MLTRHLTLGFCALVLLCGPAAAGQVTSRGSAGPARTPAGVPDPPCEGQVQGSTPARVLADAIIKAGKQDYVGAAENILGLDEVKRHIPTPLQDLFGVRDIDVGVCVRLCVVVPGGSTITGYRFADRNAGSGGNGADWFSKGFDWIECNLGQDCSIGFSSFTNPQVDHQGRDVPQVACSVFKNWSTGYGREGSFTVVYH